jgi:hypothetical protein
MNRSSAWWVLALSTTVLAACGGGDTAAGKGGTTSVTSNLTGCDALNLAPPPPGQGVQISTEMTLAPGTERQTCRLVMLGEDVNLNYGEGIFTPGSHHGTVWRTSHMDTIPTTNLFGQAEDATVAVDCSAPTDWGGTGVVAIGHSATEDPSKTQKLEHELPDDVAFKIAHNEVLLLNFHMINTSEETQTVCYKQNLPSVPADQVKQEAGMVFFYNQYITVPANGTSTADMACPVTQDITLSTAVSHMHRRGVGYTSSLLDGDPIAGGKEVQQLHHTTEWDEPPPDLYSPPLALKAGQWIRWACDYKNTEARDVAQGQQTTDEMCMFVGAYWPRNAGWEQCGYDGAGRNFGTGTMNGAQFADCWNASAKSTFGGGPADSAARYASMRCITESCPKVSALANDYIFRGKQDILTATCN